ncbi:universal stress protein [Candidatus Hecatella orcuttiae]|uniref:universal stress protein n=1 Tax=Candidatus Hecatella orcuttiae TaxID=1935119 RepID=UPI0028683882|nr:universal stress protein [Candidatus Hecatella orcuttiae]
MQIKNGKFGVDFLLEEKPSSKSVDRILVAVDGSEHSKKAADLAVDLAKKWEAELYLIHVLEEKGVPKEFKEFARIEKVPVSEYFNLVCQTGGFLGEAEVKAKAAGIKKVERICAQGNPADEIINAAERLGVDMVVLGSRGLGGFSRAIMGSVSTKVCTHVNCACVTVK